MNCIRFATIVSCWVLLATTAWAHPGHTLDQAWSHRLASPFHWFEAALFALAMVIAGWLAARSAVAAAGRRRRPLVVPHDRG